MAVVESKAYKLELAEGNASISRSIGITVGLSNSYLAYDVDDCF